jgi:hypothetical protein
MSRDKWAKRVANQSDTMFLLQKHQDHQITMGLVVTPEPTSRDTIKKAWSYALKHSPVTLDQPDYARAFELLKERHPSWQVIGSADGKRITGITYEAKSADEDIQE